jgi:CBS domain-containing protein
MQVSKVMTKGAECTRPEAKIQEAAERMKTLNVGSLPVCENDRLVGMLTDRDITVRSTSEGFDPWTVSVREAMTPNVVYCFEDDDVNVATRLMKENQIRRLVVLNRDKRLVGIISLGDVAVKSGDDQMAGETLEEVSEPAVPMR